MRVTLDKHDTAELIRGKEDDAPGRIIRGLRQAGVRNAVFILDAIDQLEPEAAGPLLDILAPGRRIMFEDHYLQAPFDLSTVLWIATATDPGAIPEGVRKRHELVDVDDTIICLGDVGVDSSIRLAHQTWWREAPGAKWLVIGNHDVDRVNQVLPVAVDQSAITLFAPGEPPLLLTHVPLLQVPAGCINVHGHLHEKESPSSNRHINVSVEQLNYRPARLSDIRHLALRLLEGRTVPGHRTRERLNIVETTMP